ncbi:MAG: HPF/RaiA family ribosome-associated protein [Myxococcota bacterium]
MHAKDLQLEPDVDERVRSGIEKRCEHLADEFPEVKSFEFTLTEAGAGYEVHGHATGKNTDVATQADATDPGPAADMVIERIEKQLRKIHDKRIFAQRRDAQRDPPKRRSG